jgi:hypothetical protein
MLMSCYKGISIKIIIALTTIRDSISKSKFIIINYLKRILYTVISLLTYVILYFPGI